MAEPMTCSLTLSESYLTNCSFKNVLDMPSVTFNSASRFYWTYRFINRLNVRWITDIETVGIAYSKQTCYVRSYNSNWTRIISSIPMVTPLPKFAVMLNMDPHRICWQLGTNKRTEFNQTCSEFPRDARCSTSWSTPMWKKQHLFPLVNSKHKM